MVIRNKYSKCVKRVRERMDTTWRLPPDQTFRMHKQMKFLRDFKYSTVLIPHAYNKGNFPYATIVIASFKY